jgi:hypothetical protein
MTMIRWGMILGILALACSPRSTQRDPPPSNRADAPVQPGKLEILFVVGYLPGPGILDRGDVAIKRRLEGRGYAVTVKSGPESQTADAEGKALVIISSTIDSESVGKKFRDVTVPVIDNEHAVFDDMQMTAPKYWRDFGYDGDKTTVTIIDPAHPLAAGLSGKVPVTTAPETIVWAIPPASAVKVAAHDKDPQKIAIFAYDTGTPMYGINAPARRVGFCFYRDTAASASSEGWALFDAAVIWALNGRPASENRRPGSRP